MDMVGVIIASAVVEADVTSLVVETVAVVFVQRIVVVHRQASRAAIEVPTTVPPQLAPVPQRRIVAHLMVPRMPLQLVVCRPMAPPMPQQRVVAHPIAAVVADRMEARLMVVVANITKL